MNRPSTNLHVTFQLPVTSSATTTSGIETRPVPNQSLSTNLPPPPTTSNSTTTPTVPNPTHNFMTRPPALELVPAGQSYTQLTYEPSHKCTVCGHVHSCQDCHRTMQFQQALEPRETKYMEPFILNTAKVRYKNYYYYFLGESFSNDNDNYIICNNVLIINQFTENGKKISKDRGRSLF